MPHILVFDSGIGGTSVLEQIKLQLPSARYSYVMDNALLPYGLQSQETIKRRLASVIQWQQATLPSVDLIVIACNTASTYALEATRALTSLPIVGVVPAIKPAVEQSVTKHIALLATPATSKNSYTASLISRFAKGCQVDLHHSTALVTMAEGLFWGKKLDQLALREEIGLLQLNSNVDHLVLGCTHFPILASEIQKEIPATIQLIDSGKAIARRVCCILDSIGYMGNKKAETYFYATAPFENKREDVQLEIIKLN